MAECMICQYDDEGREDEEPEVYVVEKPRGMMTICEYCDTTPYQCLECDNRWMYGGNADRPTCPNCRAKNVREIVE